MLNDTTHMQKFDDIQKLVLHVAEETDRVMVGTQHESKGLFKHDALSLMTATETRGWMKTEKVNGRSIHSRWLLPEAGLNDSLTPPPGGGQSDATVQGAAARKLATAHGPGRVWQQELDGLREPPRFLDEAAAARA